MTWHKLWKTMSQDSTTVTRAVVVIAVLMCLVIQLTATHPIPTKKKVELNSYAMNSVIGSLDIYRQNDTIKEMPSKPRKKGPYVYSKKATSIEHQGSSRYIHTVEKTPFKQRRRRESMSTAGFPKAVTNVMPDDNKKVLSSTSARDLENVSSPWTPDDFKDVIASKNPEDAENVFADAASEDIDDLFSDAASLDVENKLPVIALDSEDVFTEDSLENMDNEPSDTVQPYSEDVLVDAELGDNNGIKRDIMPLDDATVHVSDDTNNLLTDIISGDTENIPNENIPQDIENVLQEINANGNPPNNLSVFDASREARNDESLDMVALNQNSNDFIQSYSDSDSNYSNDDKDYEDNNSSNDDSASGNFESGSDTKSGEAIEYLSDALENDNESISKPSLERKRRDYIANICDQKLNNLFSKNSKLALRRLIECNAQRNRRSLWPEETSPFDDSDDEYHNKNRIKEPSLFKDEEFISTTNNVGIESDMDEENDSGSLSKPYQSIDSIVKSLKDKKETNAINSLTVASDDTLEPHKTHIDLDTFNSVTEGSGSIDSSGQGSGSGDSEHISVYDEIETIESGFSAWSQWGFCSHSCGSGRQERMRFCINKHKDCAGADVDTKPCLLKICPM